MLEGLVGLGLGVGVLAYLLRTDSEQECIEKAAKGDQVDIHELATAYWNKCSATYVPKSEWQTMNRQDKATVLAKREQLEQHFVNFDPNVQRLVRSVRPRDLYAPPATRHAERLATATASGMRVGLVLSFEKTFGFVRPSGSKTTYYFHADDVVEGLRDLAAGDIVDLQFGANQRGLCAKSIRRRSRVKQVPPGS